jgi:hypothetical protein
MVIDPLACGFLGGIFTFLVLTAPVIYEIRDELIKMNKTLKRR